MSPESYLRGELLVLTRLLVTVACLLASFASATTLAPKAHAEGYGADGIYYSNADIEAIIDATWDASAAPTAKAIAWRESSYIPTVTNPASGTYCLFQIHPIVMAEYGISIYDLDTPYECSAFAYQLYLDQGFSPWALTAY